MKKIFPNKTKFYRYSDFVSYTKEADKELTEIIFKNIETYYVSEEDISDNLKIEILPIGQKQYLRVKVNGNFYYIDKNGVSKNKKEILNITKLFDQTSPITAKRALPLEFEYFGYSEDFGIYGKEDLGIVYAYGTPQPIQNYSYTVFPEEKRVSLWFEKVLFGAIYPSPEKGGELSPALIQGISFSDFKHFFCEEDGKCKLKFKFLNLFTTNRPLVLEKTTGIRKVYYLISKNIPTYNHRMYYEVSENSTDEIYLFLNKEEFLSNDVINVYFLSEAVPQIILNDVSFNVYNFGFKSEYIHEETPSNIKLFVEDGQGFLLDLDDLSASYGTNLYELNLTSGTVKVNRIVLAGKDRLFFKNLILKPEFPTSYSDYADNITIYVGHGTQKNIQTLPEKLNLYIKNTELQDLVFTINSITGEKVNNVSTLDTKAILSFFNTDGEYEYVGTINADLNDIIFEESSGFLSKKTKDFVSIPTFGRHVFYLEKYDSSKLKTAHEIATNSTENIKIFWIFLDWDDLRNKEIIKSVKQLQKALSTKEITLGIFILLSESSLETFNSLVSRPQKIKSLLKNIPAVYAVGPIDDNIKVNSSSGTINVSLDSISESLLAIKDVSISNGKFFGVYVKNIQSIDLASILLHTEKDEETYERALFLRGGNIFAHYINNVPVNIFTRYNLGDIKIYVIEDAFLYNQICSSQNQNRLFCKFFSSEQFYNFGLSTSFSGNVPADIRQFFNYLSIIKNSFADIAFTVNTNTIPYPEKNAYTMLYNSQIKLTEIAEVKKRILKYKKLFYVDSQFTYDKFAYFASMLPSEIKTLNTQILNKNNFLISFDVKVIPFTIKIYINGFGGIQSTYSHLLSIYFNPQQQKIVVQEGNNTYLLDTTPNDYEHIEVKFSSFQNYLQIKVSTILSQRTFNVPTSLTTNSLLIQIENNSTTENLRIGAISLEQ